MKDLIAKLNDPERHFPGNFDTPERANAFLQGLCQEAADLLERIYSQPVELPDGVAWAVPNTRITESQPFMMLMHSTEGCQYPELLTSLYSADQLTQAVQEATARALEMAAVTAWNHHTDMSKKLLVGPELYQMWSPVTAIRNLIGRVK